MGRFFNTLVLAVLSGVAAVAVYALVWGSGWWAEMAKVVFFILAFFVMTALLAHEFATHRERALVAHGRGMRARSIRPVWPSVGNRSLVAATLAAAAPSGGSDAHPGDQVIGPRDLTRDGRAICPVCGRGNERGATSCIGCGRRLIWPTRSEHVG